MHTYIFMQVLLINQVLCPKENLLGKYSLFTLIILLKVKGDKKFCMKNRGKSTMVLTKKKSFYFCKDYALLCEHFPKDTQNSLRIQSLIL